MRQALSQHKFSVSVPRLTMNPDPLASISPMLGL